MAMSRKFPKITIDHEKCTVPFLCKKCVQVCPTVVFFVERLAEKEVRLREVDPRIPGNYKVEAPRRDKCTVCNECVEVCPVDAIRVEAP